ncbi:MAG: DUF3341 domain-containing protein [Myxococcota bacterium]|nr:DUF3341 domain-containing protein [Myxococcota bacterium]
MADETKDKTTDEEKDQVEETSEASDEEEEAEESAETTDSEDEAGDASDDSEEDEDAEADDADEEDEDEADASESDADEADSDEDDSEEAEASFAPGDEDDAEEDEDEDDSDEDEDDDDDLFDVDPEEDDEDEEDADADDLDDDEEDDVDDSDDDITLHTVSETTASATGSEDDTLDGLAAYFDYPGELLHAAEVMRDAEKFEKWDLFSPFPIHGFEEAMGIGRSWLPWVTFVAGGTGFTLANLLQFGTLTFDWPMIIGGKPYAPWPSFVPIMFELTVLIGGVTSALVMFIAAGCFRKPRIIDPEITNDRFVLWIDANDPNFDEARAFMEELDPVEIRDIRFDS